MKPVQNRDTATSLGGLWGLIKGLWNARIKDVEEQTTNESQLFKDYWTHPGLEDQLKLETPM